MTRASLVFVALVGVSACSAKPEPPKEADLGGVAVARVGRQTLGINQVVSVAKAQGVEPAEALDRLIEDALFAQAAMDKHLDDGLGTQSRMRAARVRWAERQFLYAAQAKGPPSPADIAEAKRVNWRAYDRPDAVRVVHALVKPTGARDANYGRVAREQAEKLRPVLLGAANEAEFLKLAKTVPGPYEVEAQAIPPIADDGYTTEGEGGIMDLAFTKAAFAIARPNDTSPVIESPFGFHIIRLVERIPPKRLSDAEISQAIALEVVAARAAQIRNGLLGALRKKRPVEVSAGAEALMQSVFRGDMASDPVPSSPTTLPR